MFLLFQKVTLAACLLRKWWLVGTADKFPLNSDEDLMVGDCGVSLKKESWRALKMLIKSHSFIVSRNLTFLSAPFPICLSSLHFFFVISIWLFPTFCIFMLYSYFHYFLIHTIGFLSPFHFIFKFSKFQFCHRFIFCSFNSLKYNMSHIFFFCYSYSYLFSSQLLF